MSDGPVDGLRFSHNYLRPLEPDQDSARARFRLARLIDELRASLHGLPEAVEREHGVRVPYFAAERDWEKFLKTAELRDVLDIVTTTYVELGRYALEDKYNEDCSQYWLAEVRRIFSEENLTYRIDKKGGVHFAVDDEFERGRQATISGLRGRRYANTAANFDSALKALTGKDRSGKESIRRVFAAAEGLFRLMFDGAPRLGSAEVDRHLRPVVHARYAADKSTLDASNKMLRGFKEWIDCAHFYRHEPGYEEPTEPPEEVAITMVAQGATWLRWLAVFDSKN